MFGWTMCCQGANMRQLIPGGVSGRALILFPGLEMLKNCRIFLCEDKVI